MTVTKESNGTSIANQSWRDWAQMCLRELDTIEKKIDSIETKVDSLSDTVNDIVKERMLEDHRHDLAIQSLEIRVGMIAAGAGIAVPLLIELVKWIITK
ncbi:MAG: hypothetical protein WC877_00675 [Dehalococcoidales bacterium]|jgi:hypothetical protein